MSLWTCLVSCIQGCAGAAGFVIEQPEPPVAMETRRQLPVPVVPVEPGGQQCGRPLLALVIDDMGEDMNTLYSFLGLGVPITFSVLPQATNAAEVARVAGLAGQDVLLHMPMEPLDPDQVTPGPCLTTRMSADQIRRVLEHALRKVRNALGVNNHMGSLFTEGRDRMEVVMRVLKEHGLFYLDSRTTANSQAAVAARQVGVPLLQRDVFLDNHRDAAAIEGQIRQAIRIAQERGRAVAIGHPLPETLAALQNLISELSSSVRLVPVHFLSSCGVLDYRDSLPATAR